MHRLYIRNVIFLTIYRSRRREYKLMHTICFHTLQQSKRGINIVTIITNRLLYRLPYRLEPGEMNDTINVIFLKNLHHSIRILHICLIGFHRHSANLLNAVNDLRAAIAVIIHNNYLMPRCQQFHRCMRANITGSAC